MERAIPRQQIRGLYSQRVQAQFHRWCAPARETEHSAEIRSWTLHGDFFCDQAPRADVPTSIYVHVQTRVISAFRQVPPMNLPEVSLHRKFPVSWTIFLGGPAFRCGIQRKHSAQSVILSA